MCLNNLNDAGELYEKGLDVLGGGSGRKKRINPSGSGCLFLIAFILAGFILHAILK